MRSRKVDAAIALPARLGGYVALRPLLSVTHDLQIGLRHAAIAQKIGRADGPSVAEAEVVFG